MRRSAGEPVYRVLSAKRAGSAMTRARARARPDPRNPRATPEEFVERREGEREREEGGEGENRLPRSAGNNWVSPRRRRARCATTRDGTRGAEYARFSAQGYRARAYLTACTLVRVVIIEARRDVS